MLPNNNTNRRRHTHHHHHHHPLSAITNANDDNPLDVDDDLARVPSILGDVVRTFSVPSITSSFHSQPAIAILPNQEEEEDANNYHHHRHHRHQNHDDSNAVSYERNLFLKYLAVYVLLEFILIYLNLLEFTDLIFILVTLKSTYDDLAYGPRCDKIHTLKEKIYLVSKILMFLFFAVFVFGCLTDQFVEEEPVEVQIEDDEGDENSQANDSGEVLQIWNWIYKGFRTVRFGGGGAVEEQGDEQIIIQENQNGSIDWQQSILFAVIHVVVCASKLVVVRFLLLEWELTVKSVTRFVRTL